MPSNATAKIKSALKSPLLWTALVLFAAVCTLTAWSIWLMATTQPRGHATLVVPGTPTYVYYLDEATDAEQLKKGLSGSPSMPRNEGMLFVFGQEDTQCFWMRDMRFPLDIIWVDARKRVVHVERDVSARTYPDRFCGRPAAYVIELNAGEAAKAGIRKGQVLNF